MRGGEKGWEVFVLSCTEKGLLCVMKQPCSVAGHNPELPYMLCLSAFVVISVFARLFFFKSS